MKYNCVRGLTESVRVLEGVFLYKQKSCSDNISHFHIFDYKGDIFMILSPFAMTTLQ